MNKLGLYERTKALWPKSIRKDEIWDVYLEIDRTLHSDDEWAKLAIWSFSQGLDELFNSAASDEKQGLFPSDLGFASFDRWMRLNLIGDDGWSTERQLWETE